MNPRSLLAVCCFGVVLGCVLAAGPALAQQPATDPENEKGVGLWFDETVSAGLRGLPSNSSLEFEFHQRLDQDASNLFECFFQGGFAFRPRPWLMLLPIYRYQRYPGDTTTPYENRLQLNVTLSTTRGRLGPNLRVLTEGRFPENRVASARLRFRPGIEYTLPLRMTRPPVVVVNNEFFIVPGLNSFASGGTFTQNRFQMGIRLPITNSYSVRPYFMLQSVNAPTGWETNSVFGLWLGFRF